MLCVADAFNYNAPGQQGKHLCAFSDAEGEFGDKCIDIIRDEVEDSEEDGDDGVHDGVSDRCFKLVSSFAITVPACRECDGPVVDGQSVCAACKRALLDEWGRFCERSVASCGPGASKDADGADTCANAVGDWTVETVETVANGLGKCSGVLGGYTHYAGDGVLEATVRGIANGCNQGHEVTLDPPEPGTCAGSVHFLTSMSEGVCKFNDDNPSDPNYTDEDGRLLCSYEAYDNGNHCGKYLATLSAELVSQHIEGFKRCEGDAAPYQAYGRAYGAGGLMDLAARRARDCGLYPQHKDELENIQAAFRTGGLLAPNTCYGAMLVIGSADRECPTDAASEDEDGERSSATCGPAADTAVGERCKAWLSETTYIEPNADKDDDTMSQLIAGFNSCTGERAGYGHQFIGFHRESVSRTLMGCSSSVLSLLGAPLGGGVPSTPSVFSRAAACYFCLC